MTYPPSFDAAADHFRAGRHQQAAVICAAMLLNEPRHAPAHYLLGVIAQHAGQHETAVEHFCQAVSCQPRQSAYWVGLGESLQALGRQSEAQQAYRDAIDTDPATIAAHYRLGQLHQARGEGAAAAACFRALLVHAPQHAETHNDLALVLRASGEGALAEQHLRNAIALRPDFVQAYVNLGTLLQDRGDLSAAIAVFEQVTRLQPDLAAAQFNLANALRMAGHNDWAARHYRCAIQLDPGLAAAHNNLGTLLQAEGDLAEAVAHLRAAVHLAPDFADAHSNLAQVLQQQGDLPAAVQHYRRAIALRPQSAETHYNLGTALQSLRDWSGADACYREALRLRPNYVDPRVNLGINCQARGRDTEALAWYESALSLDPEAAEAHCNRGMLLLAQGDWNAGWQEYRWLDRCQPGRPVGTQPGWNGSRLSGNSVLVRCNQGAGDTFQFLRYLPCLKQRGAGTVYVAAPESLHPLLAASGVRNLVSPERLPDFDVQVSVMLLPALFHGEAGWMTEHIPYLRARGKLVDQWRERLTSYRGFRVGICWQGNPGYAFDAWRSAPLVEYLPLASVSGVRLFSLQRGAGSEQLIHFAQLHDIVSFESDVDGSQGAFMDTAAMLANLDLIVTTDTAMAHLAGAMGRPAWVALPHTPEWRWQRHGATSPWYPSLRLFRQAAPGDWQGVFAHMAAELCNLVAGSPTA